MDAGGGDDDDATAAAVLGAVGGGTAASVGRFIQEQIAAVGVDRVPADGRTGLAGYSRAKWSARRRA